jgi:hypothetical protein
MQPYEVDQCCTGNDDVVGVRCTWNDVTCQEDSR